MSLKSSRVVSTTSCPVTTTAPVTITCPTAVTPTAVSPVTTTTSDLNVLLAQLGLSPTATAAAAIPTALAPDGTPGQVFTNPLVQLGAVNPFAALAALSPAAALAALSPTLGIFNPAINPNAALLAFNPAGAPSQALASKQGPATLPFGKFFKKPFGI